MISNQSSCKSLYSLFHSALSVDVSCQPPFKLTARYCMPHSPVPNLGCFAQEVLSPRVNGMPCCSATLKFHLLMTRDTDSRMRPLTVATLVQMKLRLLHK